MKKIISLIILLIFPLININAKVILPSIISDDMVLQRNSKVKIWGQTKTSSFVYITPSWSGEKVEAKVDKDGNWVAYISTSDAGGPYTIKISDGEELLLKNILLGDVWLCSGQSNMEMPIKGFVGQPIEKSMDAIIGSLEYPQVRMFNFKRTSSPLPQENINGSWLIPSLENTPNFSAVAYFFARTLNRVLGIPIGIIHSSWGGSTIEAWMSKDNIKKYPQYKPEEIISMAKAPNRKPTMLFNAMIYPLRNISVKGFTWYQGESNITNYNQYHDLFADMVKEWRNLFYNTADKPFYYVQIAPYQYPLEKQGLSPYMREAQASCLDVPNTGMVLTIDIGLKNGIHPMKKEDVGKRLAYQALAKTYNKSVPCDGPTLKSINKENERFILEFENADGGLTPIGQRLDGFEIAGEDGKFIPANAIVRLNKVNVWNSSIKNPKYIRYAFKDYPVVSLFNNFGLPAAPFRTDSFNIK